MDAKQLCDLKQVHMSKSAKARISARLNQEMKSAPHPEEEYAESEIYHVEHAGKWDWMRGAATGLAACLVVAVTAGMIYGVSRARPPISPGTSVGEMQPVSEEKEIITPFGDLTKTAAAFTPLGENWEKNDTEPENLPRMTVSPECLAALNEVFRVYGWQESVPADPDVRITDNCIVMHLSGGTEPTAEDALTAYFQLDDDGEHLVRVDADGQSRWYFLDDEIIRCLWDIVMKHEITEYQPPREAFGHVFKRCMEFRDTDGNPMQVTDGQQAALNDLLCRYPYYGWNTLRDDNPFHGRNITVQLMSNSGTEFLTFWLETGCLAYASQEEDCKYWIDDTAFMAKVERLLADGIYPECPVHDWQAPQISAEVNPDNRMWESMLLGLLRKAEWQAIECPLAESKKASFTELTVSWNENGMAHKLIFYPDKGFMEFTEIREQYEYHEAGTDAVSHVLSHYFSLSSQLWADVQTVLQGGIPEQMLGKQTGAPFGSLSGAELFFNTDGTGYFSVTPDHEIAVEEYLSSLTYDEMDWMEGRVAGGKYLDVFVNEQGFRHVLQVWSSGDIIEKRFDADGSEQRHWIVADGDPYEMLMQHLGEPETRSSLSYRTREEMERNLPDALAQIFPLTKQPFMNLLLSSYWATGILVPSGDEAGRFGVTLPQDRAYFHFDTFRMQSLFDTFDWTPADDLFTGWEQGYLKLQLGSGQELWFATVPTDGHYLVGWYDNSTDGVFYLADEEFIRNVLTVVQDSAELTDTEESSMVPQITAYHYEYAQKILQQKGFNTEMIYEASDEVDAGHVIRTEPEANAYAEPGTAVKLYVSKGSAEQFTMQDCTGMTQTQAKLLLEYYGMDVLFQTEASDQPSGTVIGQNIPAGTALPKGAEIILTLAE